MLDLTGKEVSFLIKKSMSGRVGWKIVPEDDNLNLKINATILEQVMSRIRWNQGHKMHHFGREHDEDMFSGICSFLGRWSLQKCRLWYSDRQRCIFTTQPNPSVSSSCVRLFNNHRKKIYIYTPAQISVDLIELAKEKRGDLGHDISWQRVLWRTSDVWGSTPHGDWWQRGRI